MLFKISALRRLSAATLTPFLLLSNAAFADDWPQWLGPERDGIWREKEIVRTFPEDGLPVQWRVPVSHGYGGPAVADGNVYLLDYVVTDGQLANSPSGPNRLTGQERVLCLSAESGKLVWDYSYPQAYNISYAGGPRCTPTVADGKVYALGAEGQLTCLDAKTGHRVWQHNLTAEYDTQTAIWGYASHPLVHGDRVYCVVGGEGSVAVAFDKNTGQEDWRALSASEPGYCPPTMIHHAGVNQLLIWHPESLNSLNPESGTLLWSVPLQPGFGMSIVAPRKLGSLLYASAIGNISALLRLDDDSPAASVVWRGKVNESVFCSNSTPFLDGEMIYGCDVETGALVGARLSDGKRLWHTQKPTVEGRRPRHATAFIVKHEDRFFLFNELGDLILAKLSPEGYQEQSRFHVLEPTNEAFGRPVVWSHPAFALQSMFARNDKELVRVDLRAQ